VVALRPSGRPPASKPTFVWHLGQLRYAPGDIRPNSSQTAVSPHFAQAYLLPGVGGRSLTGAVCARREQRQLPIVAAADQEKATRALNSSARKSPCRSGLELDPWDDQARSKRLSRRASSTEPSWHGNRSHGGMRDRLVPTAPKDFPLGSKAKVSKTARNPLSPSGSQAPSDTLPGLGCRLSRASPSVVRTACTWGCR
jgi:hypothetical protein